MSEPQFEIKSVDMPSEMQELAIGIITLATQTYNLETEIAGKIKKQMDQQFGDTWHCIVGSTFGSFVSHTSGGFIYGDIESPTKRSVLLFKTD